MSIDEVEPGAKHGVSVAAQAVRKVSVESERDTFFVRMPFGRFPVGPWWVLVLSAFLAPLAVFGLILWFAGRIVAWRFNDGGGAQAPKDARVLMAIGRACLKLFWLPATLYLRFARPQLFRSWRSGRNASVAS